MDKVEKVQIINDFVEWLIESDKNSWENLYKKERNDWLDQKLKEYKEIIYQNP